ncbi:hypothetical protein [Micromonospora sp. NPDC050200]|uniref:hypothetical protein n=1 Tax=Micromonospora sp. NPDC050200 TaxID=3155664 RepID=UPI0033EECA4E
MAKRQWSIMAVIASATLMVALSAQPAQASGSVCTVWYDNNFCSGEVKFASDGEILKVLDLRADGHGVKGFLQQYYDFSWHWVTPSSGLYNGYGNGWTAVHDYDIPEGRDVRYRVCLTDGASGSPYACSAWAIDSA